MSHDDEHEPEFARPFQPGAEDEASPGYKTDPDAPPTAEGRANQARGEIRKLLRASLVVTVVMAAVVGAWDLAHATPGFPTTVGYLLGAGFATANLWILANGFYSIVMGQGPSVRAMIAFGGSFLGLVMLAFFVVLAKREWTMGVALGLTTPAVAGILYGRSLKE